jgi:hypothetical protein
MTNAQPQIFFAYLPERFVSEQSLWAIADICMAAGQKGHKLIHIPHARTDVARNEIVNIFLDNSSSPEDVLVMLDIDHDHPMDTVERLAASPGDITGALAFRRSAPYDPQFYLAAEVEPGEVKEGDYVFQMSEWPKGQLEVEAVGFGAVAIKRRVFDVMKEAGEPFPYFRISYDHYRRGKAPGEDIPFCYAAKRLGLKVMVDTTFETPHHGVVAIGERAYRQHKAQSEMAQVKGSMTPEQQRALNQFVASLSMRGLVDLKERREE